MSTAKRVPPSDEQAEAHVLSCCILDGAPTIARCMDIGLEPGAFNLRANGELFRHLMKMLGEGKTVDAVTVYQDLLRERKLETVGGAQHFNEVTSTAPTTAQALLMAERVFEMAVVRETLATGAELVERCYNYAGQGLPDLLGGPLNRLLALSTRDTSPEPTWAAVVDEADARAQALIEHQGKATAETLDFPWPEMTATFGAMQRGQLVIIAARPSIGKSSLLRPVVAHLAQQGKRVYFDTLEVQPMQVVLQLAASLSGVGVRKLGKTGETEHEQFKSALREVRGYGITISRKDRSLAQIVARCKAIKAQGRLDLVAIDHGGLLSDIYTAGRDEKLAAISRVTKSLKTLAVDLNVPVVLLWQLNRESEKDKNREPRISDLRDSGSLEEDADKVLLIHRPSEDPLTKSPQSETDSVADRPRYFQNVIQAKGRDDGTALMSFYFTRTTATFAPAKRTERPKQGEAF